MWWRVWECYAVSHTEFRPTASTYARHFKLPDMLCPVGTQKLFPRATKQLKCHSLSKWPHDCLHKLYRSLIRQCNAFMDAGAFIYSVLTKNLLYNWCGDRHSSTALDGCPAHPCTVVKSELSWCSGEHTCLANRRHAVRILVDTCTDTSL
mgnify:CR=1 FL=1